MTTIGELIAARVSLRIVCRYCGREIRWPYTRLAEAFAPDLDANAAWERLKCKRCLMTGEVTVEVLLPLRR